MSALQTQPLAVEDFSHGITDYFIDGDPRAAEIAENLILTPNKKLRTAWGSEVVNDKLPLGTFRVNKLVPLAGAIIGFQDKRAYWDDAGTWTEITGPSGDPFLPSGDSNSVIVNAEWQEHQFFTSDSYCSPQKLYIDENGDRQVRNAGLPELPAGFSVTPAAGAGATYLYAAVIKSEYNVATVLYLDRGPVYLYPTTVNSGTITGGNPATVTLPTTFATPENWDTTNWYIEIYRTADAGTAYFKLGEVAFGTPSFNDNVPDATLITNEPLYTSDGIASNGTPPKAKFVHVVNGFGIWGNLLVDGEYRTTELRQSKSDDPDSVPSNFRTFTEQPIMGLSSIYDRPLVLCSEYIYRIDNFYSDDGTGSLILRRIDDKAGCVNPQSIVQTHVGLFWAGNQGFYWSDGFRVVCISDHLNKTYQTLVSNETKKKRICGTFEPNTQILQWTTARTANEGDTIFQLDLKFPFLPVEGKRGGSFTTSQRGEDFSPTQVLRIGNDIYRGDADGYIFKHNESILSDPKKNTATASNTWGTQAILHLYKSCALDFGSKFYRKFVPRILISADNTTNLSLAIGSSNDNDRVTGDLKPIRYKSNVTWGDSLPVWGDPETPWNKQGLIEEWRRFPARGLRCNYKQVILTNALVRIIDSDLLGTATVNPGANTATLGGSFNWLPDIVDYVISFEHDNYTREFPIIARTPTTVTYDDGSGGDPLATSVLKWAIKGKPKGEVLSLNGYVIHWAFISKSHTPFSAGSLGSDP